MFYFIFILGLLLSIGKNKKLNSKLYTGILMVLAIFRFGSGPDYFSYQYLFERLRLNVLDELYYGLDSQEYGFRLIGALFKQLGFSYQLYLAIFTIVSLFYICKIAYEFSQNPTLALTLYYSFYYFVWSYSGIRQGLVMSIGIYYLLEAIKLNRCRKFMIIVMLLSLIHTSALILLLLLLVSKLKLDKNKLIVMIALSIIFSILPTGLIVIKLAPHIQILNKIALYSNSNIFLNNVFDFQTLGRLFFLVITLLFYDKYLNTFPGHKKIINIYLFSFIVYFLFKFSELTAARLAIYGKMLDILILSNIVYSIKKRRNRFIFAILLVMILSLYLFKELSSMEKYTGLVDSNPISTPYVNIFNKDKYFYNTRFNWLD